MKTDDRNMLIGAAAIAGGITGIALMHKTDIETVDWNAPTQNWRNIFATQIAALIDKYGDVDGIPKLTCAAADDLTLFWAGMARQVPSSENSVKAESSLVRGGSRARNAFVLRRLGDANNPVITAWLASETDEAQKALDYAYGNSFQLPLVPLWTQKYTWVALFGNVELDVQACRDVLSYVSSASYAVEALDTSRSLLAAPSNTEAAARAVGMAVADLGQFAGKVIHGTAEGVGSVLASFLGGLFGNAATPILVVGLTAGAGYLVYYLTRGK
jgi:hypothetical protein